MRSQQQDRAPKWNSGTRKNRKKDDERSIQMRPLLLCRLIVIALALHQKKTSLLLLSLAILVGTACCASADSQLLSLVPHDARVLTELVAPSAGGHQNGFVLATGNNYVDLNDFLALTGMDNTRLIDQIILTAASGAKGPMGEHSLMARGHFAKTRDFKAAIENGATLSDYRGIQILVLKPFERERPMFNDLRWLAVPDSGLALLGTIASVREELDRYLNGATPEPWLTQRLAHFDRRDLTWCIVREFDRDDQMQYALRSLDPTFATLIRNADAFQFGIRYDRWVWFEYEATSFSRALTEEISSSRMPPLGGQEIGVPSQALFPERGGVSTLRGVIRLSKAQYERWLAEGSAHSLRR
jgi:hypothetical protein